MSVIHDVTPCGMVVRYHHLGGTASPLYPKSSGVNEFVEC